MKKYSRAKIFRYEGSRIKIKKKEQKELFIKFKDKLGSRKKSAKFLKIKEDTYKGYAYLKIRYLPKKIINKICLFLKEPLPKILESKTLKEIRQTTIKKTYAVLRKKYGKNWESVLAKRGYKAMRHKYGKDFKTIIANKGHEASRKKYGIDFQKKIWNKAIRSLEKKYGCDWGKKISFLGLRVYKKKYGKDWARIVMKKARKGHVKKYGEEWAKILSLKAKRKLKLTEQEKKTCRFLSKYNIPFETHCIKNGREYDVFIPNIKNPRIIIECSSVVNTHSSERSKISQLMEQKKNFRHYTNLVIFKWRNNSENLRPSTYNFLIDQGILVFWDKDLSRIAKMIKDFLNNKNKDLTKFKYFNNEPINKKVSLLEGFSNGNKLNPEELKLHNLLNKIRANPQGHYTIRTKYNNKIIFDNFEKIKNCLVAYEVTRSCNQKGLMALAGKIIYLKKLYKNLKIIVILTRKKKLLNTVADKALKEYTDVIIIKSQYNTKGLISARNKILQT